MADHNDPNSVNSIFSDIDISAADVYDMFGYPSDAADEEKVVLALTFAPVPDTGVFDTDMLYRLQVNPHARPGRPVGEDRSLSALTGYFDAMKDRYLGQGEASEIRVTVDDAGMATVGFSGFPGGTFTVRVPTTTRGRVLDVLLALGGSAYFARDLRRSLRRLESRQSSPS